MSLLNSLYNESFDEIYEYVNKYDPQVIDNIINDISSQLLKLFNSKNINDRFKYNFNSYSNIDQMLMFLIATSICNCNIDGIIYVDECICSKYFIFYPHDFFDNYVIGLSSENSKYLTENFYDKFLLLYKSNNNKNKFSLKISNTNIYQIQNYCESICCEPIYDIINIEQEGDLYHFSFPYHSQ